MDITVSKINGEKMVSSLTIKNKNTGEERDLEVNGVFIAVGIEPNSGIFDGVVEENS